MKNRIKKAPARSLISLSLIAVLILALGILLVTSLKGQKTLKNARQTGQVEVIDDQNSPPANPSPSSNNNSTNTSTSTASNTSATTVDVNGQQIDVPANGSYYSSTATSNGQTTVNVDSSHHSTSGTSSSNNSSVNINVNNSSN